MIMRKILPTVVLLFSSAAAVTAQAPAAPALWTMSEQPVLEIGVAEGDPSYELFDAISSVRLLDGRIAVLNAGSADLRFFDAKGKFLFKVGGKGNGPGEYRSPARVYYTHEDSLLVYDPVNIRESHLTTNGRFISSADGAPVKTESFKRDVWLYRRNFVDGPALAAERKRVKPALDRLPAIPPGQYRYVKVDPWYRLWVRSAQLAGDPNQSWMVYSAEGRPVASLVTPAGFEIHQIGPDFLLGRARTDLDVETIRLYSLEGAGLTTEAPYFTPASARMYTPAASAPESPMVADVRAYLRQMMSQQEIHYSKSNTYTSDVTQLKLPDQNKITPYILQGTQNGWAAVVVHRDADLLCGVTQGWVGWSWTPGRVVCGEARAKR
jgi:hypothetical protein